MLPYLFELLVISKELPRVPCMFAAAKKGHYVVRPSSLRESRCQEEVDVHYADIEALPLQGEFQSLPPLRMLSFGQRTYISNPVKAKQSTHLPSSWDDALPRYLLDFLRILSDSYFSSIYVCFCSCFCLAALCTTCVSACLFSAVVCILLLLAFRLAFASLCFVV